MKKAILCYVGLASVIIGLILFTANAPGLGYGPHHSNWKTIALPFLLIVGGLVFFALNLNHED